MQNIQQLVDKKYDIAFSLADTAADAVTGKGAFEGKQADVKALARIYSNYTQVVVSKKSGITKVEDFKGKRISTGSPKSGTEVIANRLIQAAGLDPAKDVSAQRLDLTKTVDAHEGRQHRRARLVRRPAHRWHHRPHDGDEGRRAVRRHHAAAAQAQGGQPGLRRGRHPGRDLRHAADAKTVVVPNVLLVRSDMSDANACALTKLLFDKKADLEKVHPAAKDLDPATAKESDPVSCTPDRRRRSTASADRAWARSSPGRWCSCPSGSWSCWWGC